MYKGAYSGRKKLGILDTVLGKEPSGRLSVKLVIKVHGRSFNPLPPPKRGETCQRGDPRDEGDRMFQSTPPAEARGDLASCETNTPSG